MAEDFFLFPFLRNFLSDSGWIRKYITKYTYIIRRIYFTFLDCFSLYMRIRTKNMYIYSPFIYWFRNLRFGANISLYIKYCRIINFYKVFNLLLIRTNVNTDYNLLELKVLILFTIIKYITSNNLPLSSGILTHSI